MDIRFYWLQDRADQGICRVNWGPGNKKLADYSTKRFAPSHHKTVRPIYICKRSKFRHAPKVC